MVSECRCWSEATPNIQSPPSEWKIRYWSKIYQEIYSRAQGYKSKRYTYSEPDRRISSSHRGSERECKKSKRSISWVNISLKLEKNTKSSTIKPSIDCSFEYESSHPSHTLRNIYHSMEHLSKTPDVYNAWSSCICCSHLSHSELTPRRKRVNQAQ